MDRTLKVKRLNKPILIPTFISSLRAIALAPFLYLNNQGNTAVCLGLLAFCAATDYLDGYFARKTNTASKFGAYYDALTDFILMFGIFVVFTLEGLYALWLPVLMAVAFLQFLATSVYTQKIYDPIGRYIGSALYIGVVLTLLFPTQAIYNFVQYAFLGFIVASFASRIVSLTKKTTLR